MIRYLFVVSLAGACLLGQEENEKPALPVVHTTIVISAKSIEPDVELKNSEIFSRTLFSRDDQIFHVLDAGINAGQHEGGGKSLEIRRFGFNLDHGGVSGGLKVLVDDVQQNQSTQGHGQGYLGSLKSVTPELIQEVNIINGPFSAEYGDFSGLGVVHIRLRESLPDEITARIQGGSFGSARTFLGWSPNLDRADSFFAYEGNRTDGPFVSPLRYGRNNVTANYTRRLDDRRKLGFRFNGGLNRFYSSGQIPLDEVAAGRLDRFGAVDPSDGGRVRAATAAIYFSQEGAHGDVFKADGFAARSLFDLYSNFTFFLNDPINGDGIQQHDSRLQEGGNAQYLRPHKVFGGQALFTAGSNIHANQINVALYSRLGRMPTGTQTSALARWRMKPATSRKASLYGAAASNWAEGCASTISGSRFWIAWFPSGAALKTPADGSLRAAPLLLHGAARRLRYMQIMDGESPPPTRAPWCSIRQWSVPLPLIFIN
jgi:hypothetical protein